MAEKFVPEGLEKCPDHPNALVKKITDSTQYIMNGEAAGKPITNYKYYCYECNKELVNR